MRRLSSAGSLLCAVALVTACASTSPRMEGPPAPATTITASQIEDAQRAWCGALLEISRLGMTGGDAKAYAATVLSTAYDFDNGTVLFKPTLTFGAQTFRMSKEGALAYFVGGDPRYPDDSGFALKPWTACRAVIEGTVLEGNIALAMGNVFLTDQSGKEIVVDKSFGYRLAPDGVLRIVLHHSSLPYVPGA